MTEATLGLKVESSGAEAATREFEKLKKVASQAEMQFRNIEAVAKRNWRSFSETAEKYAAAQQKTVAPLRAAVQGTNEYARAAQNTYGIQERLSKSQLNVIRNYETLIGRTMLSGKQLEQFNALRRAGVTADTEAGKVIARLAGEYHDLTVAQNKTERSGSNLANTLTRRIILGFMISQVREMARSVLNLNSALAKVGDTASRVNIGSGNLQGYQYSAAIKGVDSSTFLDSMLKFNQQVAEAKNGLGSLAVLFRANGIAAKGTEDSLLKVADLVKNARTDADKFSIAQQAGLPATREMVKFLEQGADAIRRAAAEAPKVSDEAIKRAKELDEQWNRLWENIARGAKKAIVEVSDPKGWQQAGTDAAGYFWAGFKAVRDFLPAFAGRPPEMQGPPVAPPRNLGSPALSLGQGLSSAASASGTSGVGTAAATRNPEIERQLNALALQRLSVISEILTVEQKVALVRLQAAANPETTPSAEHLKRLQDIAKERALGIDQIKASSDAYRIESETIGMSAGQAEAYRIVQSRIAEELRKGNELLPENIALIRQQAEAMAANAMRAEELKFGYDTMKGFMLDFRNSIQEGATAMEALQRAGVNALSKIAEKLMEMAAQQLWQAAFPGGGGGGGGGLLGSIFGGGTGFLHTPGGFSGAFPMPFANGGYTGPGGKYQPAGIVHAGEYVFSQQAVNRLGVGNLERLHRGYAEGGAVSPLMSPPPIQPIAGRGANDNSGAGEPSINVNIVSHNDFRGSDAGSEARIRTMLDRRDAKLREQVIDDVQRVRRNNPRYLSGG